MPSKRAKRVVKWGAKTPLHTTPFIQKLAKKAQEVYARAYDQLQPSLKMVDSAIESQKKAQEWVTGLNGPEITMEVVSEPKPLVTDNSRKKTIVYLNDKGELYVEDKGKIMRMRGRKREQMIRKLKPSFTTTQKLRAAVGAKSTKSVEQAMVKMRSKFKAVFGLEPFIEGSRGRGYRIHPEYQLMLVNN